MVIVMESMDRSWEIIYVNDGSTDRTEEMIEGYRKTDQRIKVIEFKGISDSTWRFSRLSSGPPAM